jgi:ribosome modulation factor
MAKPKHDPPQPPIPRDTPECKRGRWAWYDGQSIDDCPYRTGDDRRTGWLVGWLDARTENKFPQHFS